MFLFGGVFIFYGLSHGWGLLLGVCVLLFSLGGSLRFVRIHLGGRRINNQGCEHRSDHLRGAQKGVPEG